MKQWFAAALMLAATTVSAETGKVGPPRSESKDGSFFVSWRYVTPSSGMVYATPKLKSKEPPQFTKGEPFELSITLRVPPNTENPCALRPETDSPCTMEAVLLVHDSTGTERAVATWREAVVLENGMDTFTFQGQIESDVTSTGGRIDFRVRKGGESVLKDNNFPFRISR